jgi:aldehyde:ferredoxin oxidoreductase
MGTQVLMSVINEVGGLPTRNHRDNQFEGAKDIGAEAMATPRKTDGKKQLVTNQACFGCTIACGRISKMDENHFTIENKPQYRGASGGLEYEAAWALGAANGVNDLEALQYVNMLCNEEGIDPITFGTTIGAVMELYAMGILTKEQVGIEATFGSARALGFPGRRNRQRTRFWQGNWPGFQAPDRQIWPPRVVHVVQGPGIPRL